MKSLFALLGSVALALYMFLFTAGVALDSKPYRDFLAPIQSEGSDTHDAPADPDTGTIAATASASPLLSARKPTANIAFTREHVGAFLRVMFVYTPLNIAFLALIAGFLGGCASYITYTGVPVMESRAGAPARGGRSGDDTGDTHVSDAPARDHRQTTTPALAGKHVHRTESPFASMFRSFLVYLGMMAGMYVIADNPFKSPTPEQYVRLASTVSLFAFVVGYDPSKFRDWIDRVPKFGGAN